MTDFTLRNEPFMAKLQIRKVDRTETERCLGEAEFELYRVESDNKETLISTLETGLEAKSLGIAGIGSLPVGTYHLKETKAPVGYALLTEPIVITVGREDTGTDAKVKVEFGMGTSWADDEGTTGAGNETNGHLTYDAGTNTFTIVVPNVLLYELPSTGGAGTSWYTIGGTLLLMVAALVLYKRKYAGRY